MKLDSWMFLSIEARRQRRGQQGAAAAAEVAARRPKNPSNGFGGEKMRFTFGVDLTRAMLLQY